MKTLISLWLLSLIALFALPSHAQIGRILVWTGEVSINNQRLTKDQTRPPIQSGDQITTGANGYLQFLTLDGTLVELSEQGHLEFMHYRYQAEATNNLFQLTLYNGKFGSHTGDIKHNQGTFHVYTPAGLFKPRGTHYEIEIIQGEVFIAIWDGAVDVNVEVSGNEQEVSLGEGEDYAYAKIDETGEVTELLAPPENFNEGHSSDPATDTEQPEEARQAEGEDEQRDPQQETSNPSPEGDQATNQINEQPDTTIEAAETSEFTDVATLDLTSTESFNTGEGPAADFSEEQQLLDNQFSEEALQTEVETAETVEESFTPDVIANRTGHVIYSHLIDSQLSSSAGGANNLQIEMSIDFDRGAAQGQLSLSDQEGDWFATFAGGLSANDLKLLINYATHGNELADGQIRSQVTDESNRVNGSFSLYEVNTPTKTVNGRFILE